MASLEPENVTDVIGSSTKQFMEVSIPVPWGVIAGKWWGPTSVRPILCVHGLYDNAGVYDRVIPVLPKHIGYLAIDYPGHGRSSWLPNGMGSSMGAAALYLYGGLYPDKVDLLIGLDTLKPTILSPDRCIDKLKMSLELHIKSIEMSCANVKPPSYTKEEMIRKRVAGSLYSLTSDSVHYLLERETSKSKDDPDKLYFTRDYRLKSASNRMLDNEVLKEMARRIKFPLLYYKSKDSPYYEDVKYRDEVMSILQEQNPKFEYYLVEGKHHLHLTHIESIKETLVNFITKYRPSSNRSDVNETSYMEQSKL